MLHGDTRSKLLLLFLLTNLNCYKGNDKIDEQRKLYPDTYDFIKDSISFIRKVNKNDLMNTLFLNLKIKNPSFKNQAVEICSDKINEKLKSIEGTDILTLFVEHAQEGEITKKFIDEEADKIKQAIIDHKYKKIFKHIIVSVIYDGGMRVLAQHIIKKLTDTDVYEICFNPDEEPFKIENGLEEVKEGTNSEIKNLKTKFDQYKKNDFEVEDERGKKNKIDNVVNEVVNGFFIES